MWLNFNNNQSFSLETIKISIQDLNQDQDHMVFEVEEENQVEVEDFLEINLLAKFVGNQVRWL